MYKKLPLAYQVSDAPLSSYAISQSGNTALALALRNQIQANKGKSGFKLLAKGSESFGMRLAMIQAAEKTIDLQYYSINDDTTSNLLLEALVQAVRRRVRIRFLLDDINFAEVSETFCVLNKFKNIDIKVFNPFAPGRMWFFEKWMNMLVNLNSVNHRMHNKALIVDNQMAIIGGRNLGDEYFEEHTDVTFRDIDIMAAGPITADISQSFDQYWNSKNASPLCKLHNMQNDLEKTEKIRRDLHNHWKKIYATEKGQKLLSNKLTENLKNGDIKLIWAHATIAADSPSKIEKLRNEVSSPPISRLYSLLEKAKKEFIAVSPYFVPRSEGVEKLAALVKRGVSVKILTNSLGSTDVVAVHAGYRRYRKEMLKNGIELYEMKPIGGKRPRQRLIGKKVPARASLHAKLYVVDRKALMIGSFNLDPRSIELNTEIGIIVHSEELADQVVKMYEDVSSPDMSYQLQLKSGQDAPILWKAREKNAIVEYSNEPNSGLWRRIETNLIAMFPVENHL